VPPGLPLAGGASGLLCCLQREWPGTSCKIIDFDGGQAAARMAELIFAELCAPSDAFEVGYPGGERMVFTAVPAPLDADGGAPALAIAADWVVLALGGARGITAEVVKSWARPGMMLVLVGRAELASEEDPATARLADTASLRAHLIECSQAAGRIRRPAEIERAVTAILHRREAARTVATLRGMGARVEYHACDVSDGAQLAGLIADIYARHGRIDAVLHGAGVIEDKALVDKTDESIDRVFDTKVDAAFTLYRALRPDQLKALVFFASVAGRFGNRGQADYAAANEVLNRMALRMAAEWPTVRVLSVNWGPWAEVGMAVGAFDHQAEGARFALIRPEEGCGFLRDELERGAAAEVEIIAGDVPPTEAEGESAGPDLLGAAAGL
jgi:NAD(P)-dependent dehydrogenase (short-subunit alcohol dehydrogenase family)